MMIYELIQEYKVHLFAGGAAMFARLITAEIFPTSLAETAAHLGIFVTLVIFFVWKDHKREEGLIADIKATKRFQQETLTKLVQDETIALLKVEDALEKHTTAVNRNTQVVEENTRVVEDLDRTLRH